MWRLPLWVQLAGDTAAQAASPWKSLAVLPAAESLGPYQLLHCTDLS